MMAKGTRHVILYQLLKIIRESLFGHTRLIVRLHFFAQLASNILNGKFSQQHQDTLSSARNVVFMYRY